MGVALVLWAAPTAWAASGDADGTYTVTVTKVEISKDGGTTYKVVFEGSQVINLRSVDAGAVAAGLASGVALEEGLYDTVRVTLGANLLVKGYVNNTGASTTWYTDGGTDTGAFTELAGLDNTTASDYASSTITIPEVSRTQVFSSLTLQVSSGQSQTIKVNFGTSGVITFSGTPSVSGPSVTIT